MTGMRLGNEAKVGLVVFAAFIGLLAIYWFLGGFGLRGSTYPLHAVFENVQKLDKGQDVRMAGVKIGMVSKVSLTPDSKARVDMLIDKDNVIPLGSVARVTTGAVIGESYVEILPSSSKSTVGPNSKIGTQPVVQLDEIMAQSGALVHELQLSAESLNKILGDKELVGSIKDTVTDLRTSAETAQALLASAQGVVQQSSPKIDRAFENLAKATDSAVRISNDIEAAIQDARPGMRGIMQQANEATKNLNESIEQAQALLASVSANSGKITEAFDKVNSTLDQAQQTMTNLNQASAGIKDIATDKQLHEDLRTSLRNAAEASQEAKSLVGGLSKKFLGVSPFPTPVQKASIPDYGVSADVLWNAGTGEPRFDANYTFAGFEKSFYRAGLFDIGSNTKINLQAGTAFDRDNAIRYGLYASELGIGYDRRFTPAFRIAADLYNPSDVTLQFGGIFSVNESLGLYAGFANVFGGSQKDVLVGLHYNK